MKRKLKYHTIKLNYKGIPIVYRVSDEILEWLFISDYSTYLKRCDILTIYIINKIVTKIERKEKKQL